MKDKVHDKVCDTQRGIRLAVGIYYLQVLGSPPRIEWGRRNGTVAHICELWDIPTKFSRRVKHVLEQLNTKGIEKFDGNDIRTLNTGRPQIILPGSSEEGIIADWMEDNMGFRNTMVMVNQHCRD